MALDHLVRIYQQGEDDQRARAEAAEARIAKLETALRRIAATPIEGVRGAERPQAIAQATLDDALKGGDA